MKVASGGVQEDGWLSKRSTVMVITLHRCSLLKLSLSYQNLYAPGAKRSRASLTIVQQSVRTGDEKRLDAHGSREGELYDPLVYFLLQARVSVFDAYL